MVYLTEPSGGVRGASVISIIRPEDNTAASESMVMYRRLCTEHRLPALGLFTKSYPALPGEDRDVAESHRGHGRDALLRHLAVPMGADFEVALL